MLEAVFVPSSRSVLTGVSVCASAIVKRNICTIKTQVVSKSLTVRAPGGQPVCWITLACHLGRSHSRCEGKEIAVHPPASRVYMYLGDIRRRIFLFRSRKVRGACRRQAMLGC